MLREIIVEELETGTSVINLILSIFMLSIYTGKKIKNIRVIIRELKSYKYDF